MLYFIESSFPAFLTQFVKKGFFIYSQESVKYAPISQKKLVIKSIIFFKILKIFASLLQLKCTFQGGFGLAYNLSRNKSVISDGILTEWLYKEQHINPKNFISISKIEPSINVQNGKKIILGNNFYEFGSISKNNYKKYLLLLKKKFPDAYYFPHPKEKSNIPSNIFTKKLIISNYNIETYCKIEGIPENIISFIGSTAVASLALMSLSNLIIDAIVLNSNDYDGPLGNVTDPILFQKKKIKVTTEVLEKTVFEILNKKDNITINKHFISLS
jgi:hypothetical protein